MIRRATVSAIVADFDVRRYQRGERGAGDVDPLRNQAQVEEHVGQGLLLRDDVLRDRLDAVGGALLDLEQRWLVDAGLARRPAWRPPRDVRRPRHRMSTSVSRMACSTSARSVANGAGRQVEAAVGVVGGIAIGDGAGSRACPPPRRRRDPRWPRHRRCRRQRRLWRRRQEIGRLDVAPLQPGGFQRQGEKGVGAGAPWRPRPSCPAGRRRSGWRSPAAPGCPLRVGRALRPRRR